MNTTRNTGGTDVAMLFSSVSLALVLLNFYYFAYGSFEHWGYTSIFTDRIHLALAKTGLFKHPLLEKLYALVALLFSFIATSYRKDVVVGYKWPLIITLLGLISYFDFVFYLLPDGDRVTTDLEYMSATGLGYLLIIGGGARLSAAIGAFSHRKFFRKDTGGFLQEERRINTDHSLNFRARYVYNGKTRKSFINITNPRRGVLLIGSPGCGKSYFIIEPAIQQLIEKGMALFIYDFKYPTLTKLAYHSFLENSERYPSSTRFYCINFTDLSRSHRCNLIDPKTLRHTSDAFGISKTMLYSINPTWVTRKGDFFVESAINLVASLIWYLKTYKDGIYCTLPHVIQFAQTPYDQLFTLLNVEESTNPIISPFIQAYLNKTMEMLDGQITTATIALTRLVSSDIYYVLSGNDLGLDINDRHAPAILCLGGDASRQEALAPVLSLYIDRLNNSINAADRHPSALILDEFGTIRAASVLNTIATARSNKVMTLISVQDLSQLQTQYSFAEAKQVMNTAGNVICGQVGGETASLVSEKFDSVVQYKTTIAVNDSGSSISKSEQMTAAITPATTATLSSGEFVGIVADDPEEKIKRKRFHSQIIKDKGHYRADLPIVHRVTEEEINENFARIKREVKELVEKETKRIMGDPALRGKVVKR